jgi:hypothetical protein
VSFLRTLRKLVLGETWRLPLGITAAVLVAVAVRAAAGADGWWRDLGGVVLGAGLLAAFAVSLLARRGP